MAQVAVVIRHLVGFKPTVSTIISEPVDLGHRKLQLYFKEASDTHIQMVKNDFIEFKEAEFYVNIVNITN